VRIGVVSFTRKDDKEWIGYFVRFIGLVDSWAQHKKMRLILIIFIILPICSFGQGIKVLVVDSATSNPLPFANIYFQNSGIGASTSINGYAIFNQSKLQERDSLIVSYIGYTKKKVLFVSSDIQSTLKVKLRTSDLILTEVEVKYVKPPKPEKIIREAIKNTSKNYPSQDVIYNTLYRETVKENDSYIQLNEAIVEIYYTEYPQKKLDPKIWLDWYDNESYAFEFDGNDFFHPLLKDFNTKRDHQTVVASRYSDNLSTYGIETTLVGDPLLLLAFDKIKYQYDFFNPSILNKYQFKHEHTEMVNDEACHVISFHPELADRKFIIDQSRKNKSAIYVGRIYISKETFALVKFQYNLAVDRDYGFFANRMPLDYHVEMTYRKHNDIYIIDKIKFSETKKVGTKDNGESILHKATKELYVNSVQLENVTPFADTTLFHSTRFSSIRYYRKNYNPTYWNIYDLPESSRLDSKLISDLELYEPLSTQFDSFQQQKKKMLPTPNVFKHYHSFNYHDSSIIDSLHWMALPAFKNELKKYLSTENEYAKNELVEDKSYQKKLFDALNNFYPEADTTNKTVNPGTFFFDQDSLDHDALYYQKDSVTAIPILDITAFEYQHQNIFIKQFIPNPSKSLVAVQYERVGIIGDFVGVAAHGENVELDSFSNVYSIEWLTDSTLIYSKSDKTGRAGELRFRCLKNNKDSSIYVEYDPTFDVEIVRKGLHLFCTIQSKTENEIYMVKLVSNSPRLEPVKARRLGVFNSIMPLDGIYLLVNDEKTGSTIEYANFDNTSQTKIIAHADKDDYIVDFIPLKNRIVGFMYENSIPKLKEIKRGEKKWNELELKLGIGQFQLHASSSDTIGFTFSFSSPSTPPKVYRYEFETQKLIELSNIKVHSEVFYKHVSAKRIWAKSHDQIKVPITILNNRASITDQKRVILKVYGAYGANTTPSFNAQDAILLEQGYTIAYAHVRGESILGADWYKQGRESKKINSILDYLACAEYLIKKGIASPKSLIGYGNSAGGLIVAQAINIKPDLFNTVILDHPYLDVVNTMMNDTLPLTVDEYKEWGNPQKKDVFDYIQSYSPYQNIKPQEYPNVFLIASYMDYQTPVWQSAKYTAKLRENNLSETNIIMLTDMNSGHIGNTTGKEWIKLFAEKYSFIKSNN